MFFYDSTEGKAIIEIFDLIESQSLDSIINAYKTCFNLNNEYLKHKGDTIRDLNKSYLNRFCVAVLRSIRPVGEVYYKLKGVKDTNIFFNKPPYYQEFVNRLKVAIYSNRGGDATIFEAIHEIKNNTNKYRWLYNRLSDQKSKDVLKSIMLFRLTQDLEYINLIKDPPETQYFDYSLMASINKNVFVDVGAFEGETTLAWHKLYKTEIEEIYLYEPDECNYKFCLDTLKKNRIQSATLKKMGVGDSNNQLSFSSGKGCGSKVSTDGLDIIQQTTLDEDIKCKISYIKMDIEGYEIKAIKGARQHLINDDTSLAVCTYHYLSDIWKIAEELDSYREDYKFYLRHYSNSGIETVLYAIPKS